MRLWVCETCHDKGAVRVHYTESPGYDVAICTCPTGQLLRRPQNLIAYAWRLGEPVYYLEQLTDGRDTSAVAVPEPFEAAGQKARRFR